MSGFYAEGLRFTCKNCTYCCREEPGYVFLSENDLQALCLHFDRDREYIIMTYCRIVDLGSVRMISLTEDKNNACEFLTANGCSIYDARPLQCRSYPFWQSLLESREDWRRESESCPGIDTGRLHSRSEIEDWLLRRRQERLIQL